MRITVPTHFSLWITELKWGGGMSMYVTLVFPASDLPTLKQNGVDREYHCAGTFLVVDHLKLRKKWPCTSPWWWWLFPRVRGFWENVRQFVPRQRFFFFKWRLARANIHSLGQDQSTVAQRAETTVTECSLTSCV